MSTAVLQTFPATDLGTGIAGAKEIELTGYSTVTVSASGIALTDSTDEIFCQFGYNDGSSTTWFTTSGNYRRNREEDTASDVTSQAEIILSKEPFGDYGNEFFFNMMAHDLDLAVPTWTEGEEVFNDPGGGSYDAAFWSHLVAALDGSSDPYVINRMRIFSTQPGTSGTIYVLKEKRDCEIIATIDVSTMGNTHDIDVTGYSNVRLLTLDMVQDASTAGCDLRVGTDASTFASGASDYRCARENGSSSGTATFTRNGMVVDGNATSAKAFAFHLRALDVACPTVAHGAEFVVGANNIKWWDIRSAAEVNTHLRWVFGAGISGSSGTLYVVGETEDSVLLDTIDVSAMGASHAVDLSGYNRALWIADNAVLDSAVGTRIHNSADGGSTYDETAGDYTYKFEEGSNEGQSTTAAEGHVVEDHTVTAKRFMCEVEGLAVATYTMMRTGGWGANPAQKWRTMHKTAEIVDNQKFQIRSGGVGSSGTIYVVAQDTGTTPPSKPTIISATPSETSVQAFSSTFVAGDGGTHAQSRWSIRRKSDGVHITGSPFTSSAYLTSFNGGLLVGSTEYEIAVEYQETPSGEWSPMSDWFTFTTLAPAAYRYVPVITGETIVMSGRARRENESDLTDAQWLLLMYDGDKVLLDVDVMCQWAHDVPGPEFQQSSRIVQSGEEFAHVRLFGLLNDKRIGVDFVDGWIGPPDFGLSVVIDISTPNGGFQWESDVRCRPKYVMNTTGHVSSEEVDVNGTFATSTAETSGALDNAITGLVEGDPVYLTIVPYDNPSPAGPGEVDDPRRRGPRLLIGPITAGAASSLLLTTGDSLIQTSGDDLLLTE